MAWLVRTLAFSGPESVMAELATLSSACRNRALREWAEVPRNARKWFGRPPQGRAFTVRKFYGQLSHLKRSLPLGSQTVVDRVLKNLPTVLCSPGSTQPDVLTKLRDHTEKFGRLYGGATSLRMKLTSGATIRTKRADGGVAAEWQSLRETLYRPKDSKDERTGTMYMYGAPPSCMVYRMAEVVGPDGVLRQASDPDPWVKGAQPFAYSDGDRWACEASISRLATLYRSGHHPVVVPTAVSERGWKARAVTMGPALCQVGGQFLRKTVFGALRRYGPTGNTLAGLERKAVHRLLRRPRSWPGVPGDALALSCDLTQATDYLHHDAAFAAWEGFCRGCGFTDDIRDAGLLLLGPCFIPDDVKVLPDQDFVKDGEPCGRLTRRGVLMGMPLSWAILCLTQSYCAEDAGPPDQQLPSWWKADPRSWRTTFSICGDDLIAVWPRRSIHVYEKSLSHLGYRISEGKHFSSARGGVFLEQLFLLQINRKSPDFRSRPKALVRVKRSDLSRLTWAERCTMRPEEGGEAFVVESSRLLPKAERDRRRGTYITRIRFLGTVPTRVVIPRGDRDSDPACTVGPALKVLAGHRDEKVALRLGSIFWGRLGPVCRKRGIPPELPRCLGGAELPWCRTNLRTFVLARKALTAYLTQESLETRFLESCWSRSPDNFIQATAEYVVRDAFTAGHGELKIVKSGGETPFSYVDDMLIENYDRMVQGMGPPVGTGSLPPGFIQCVRSVQAKRLAILEKHAWGNPWRMSKKGLAKALDRYRSITTDWTITSEGTTFVQLSNGTGYEPIEPFSTRWQRAAYGALGWSQFFFGKDLPVGKKVTNKHFSYSRT